MPWKETCVLDERIRFIAALLEGREMAELCREFGISRQKGYKWWNRYLEEGVEGLADRSRAPKNRPHAIPDEVVTELLVLRRERPAWGPKKLRVLFQRLHPELRCPAVSTIGAILKRHGLTGRRQRRRRHTPPWGRPFVGAGEPNAVWSADYKGDFVLGNGQRCYPLTMTDNCSRLILRIQAMPSTELELAWPVFVSAFREFGLPAAMRTDNGPPFASTSFTGLSRLSVRLIKLGVTPERIRKGRPDENGRHERMHRTLKAEACTPASHSMSAQQLAFERFRTDFNEVRPHEALDMGTPSEAYIPSPREFPEELGDPEYDSHYVVRKVTVSGSMHLHKHTIQCGTPLAGERVGCRQIDEHCWVVRFGHVDVGFVDMRLSEGPRNYQRLQPLPPELSWDAEERVAGS